MVRLALRRYILLTYGRETLNAEKISNLYDALVGALTLAITAPTEEKAQKAARLAECFAGGLSATR